jgi:hypothetical protein
MRMRICSKCETPFVDEWGHGINVTIAIPIASLRDKGLPSLVDAKLKNARLTIFEMVNIAKKVLEKYAVICDKCWYKEFKNGAL